MTTTGHTILIAQAEGDRSDAVLFQILPAEAGLDGLSPIATTSGEAVRALLERGGIDLVLLPTAGGQAAGGETLGQIREAYPAVPVVVVADSVYQTHLSVAVRWGIATSRELFDGPHDMLDAAVPDLKCG